MFQFALDKALFAFTYHRPAFAPLFKLPPPNHEKNKGPRHPESHKAW